MSIKDLPMQQINKELVSSLYCINRIISHLIKYHAHKSDFTIEQIYALIFIGEKKQASMSQVAQYLGISPASATSIIDRLIKAGWLKRTLDCDDRRLVLITIAKGKESVLNDAVEKELEAIYSALNKIDTKDKKMILNFAKTIREGLEDRAYKHEQGHAKSKPRA